MKELCAIESGSREIDELDKMAAVLAGRLKGLGGKVELVEVSDVSKMADTPDKIGRMVRATFSGAGTRKILLQTRDLSEPAVGLKMMRNTCSSAPSSRASTSPRA